GDVGHDERDDVAAVADQPPGKVIHVIAECLGGLEHLFPRGFGDAGSIRECTRDSRARNTGTFGNLLRTHEGSALEPASLRSPHVLPVEHCLLCLCTGVRFFAGDDTTGPENSITRAKPGEQPSASPWRPLRRQRYGM